MKASMCKNIALDCWMEDLMCMDNSPSLLTDEGFEHFKKKYEREIDELMNEMSEQMRQEEIREQAKHKNNKETYVISTSDDTELPFMKKETK